MTAVAADLVLIAVTRVVPWRDIPVLTAAGVATIAGLTAVVVPADTFASVFGHGRPVALTGVAVGAAGVANLVNNLPAVLLARGGVHRMSWGLGAWLLGVKGTRTIGSKRTSRREGEWRARPMQQCPSASRVIELKPRRVYFRHDRAAWNAS
jgi:hypothetical protein